MLFFPSNPRYEVVKTPMEKNIDFMEYFLKIIFRKKSYIGIILGDVTSFVIILGDIFTP